MAHFSSATIEKHTTSSTPRPHILYVVQVTLADGSTYEVQRRFSEFVTLQHNIKDEFALPAKLSVVTTLLPLIWVNDELIESRKKGLRAYLICLLGDPIHSKHIALREFLSLKPTGDIDAPTMTELPGSMRRSRITFNEDKKAPIVASYYPSWAVYSHPPERIDFSKFDVLFFAFVTPTGIAGIAWDDGSEDTLRRLVSGARQSGHQTRIVLSVGGWGGCHWFSQAMSSATNRLKLVTEMVGIVNLHGLDGIDIDWEYPNAPGNGNPHSPDDIWNLLQFFQLLRVTLGPTRIISAAVTHQPWLGSDSRSLDDVSAFADVLTFVNIMNYDVFGASENPGPNAPLGNLCGTTTQPTASAHAAVVQWTKAKMPASKLLLGLAMYGYVSRSRASRLSGSAVPSSALLPHPRRQSKGDQVADDSEASQGDLSGFWGQQIAFQQFVSSGALTRNSDGNYGQANGYTMGWDDCSDTPFLFNTGRSTVVTYDDTYSIASKAQFAKGAGLAGCFTWSLDQDDNMALHNALIHNFGR